MTFWCSLRPPPLIDACTIGQRLPPRPLSRWQPFYAPRRAFSEGLIIRGESGAGYRLVHPLGTVRGGLAANVWKAVRESDDCSKFVAKGPSQGDDKASNWPAFRHETNMQRSFCKSPMIRHMVDFAPEIDITRPMMILEPFGMTLWDARRMRPFSTNEIKWIMQGVMIALFNIHRKGLVFTDLKMENIGISGFDNEKPNGNPREIKVRLADLGAVSSPGTREISALTYRSPEVHFGKLWDQSTDIWSWGIVLAQLLLAQVDFRSPGMYDSIAVGSLEEKTKAARDAMAVDFDLHSSPLYTDDVKSQAMLPPGRPEMAYKWAEAMMAKGISGEDVQFLANTLNPLPGGRFTTVEILESGYLDI